MRIVSLVPSLTEAIAQTPGGLATLVGATAWCTHPEDLAVPRIGGTKNPDHAQIADLAPDLIIANEEENKPDDLAKLAQLPGTQVLVTNIRTVADAFDELPKMLAAAQLPTEPGWLRDARRAWAAPTPLADCQAVTMIWRKPWMAVGCDTYAGDVLARLGVRNVLADNPERYPKVELATLPPLELVVLPDEPYQFTAEDGPDAFDVPCALVSGRHLTWYGPAMATAPQVLHDQLARAFAHGN